MSPEKQRIAIAEACGWINQGAAKKVPALRHRWVLPDKAIWDTFKTPLPFLNDLNAMHEAEKVLTEDQSGDYANILCDVLTIPHAMRHFSRAYYILLHATASQRAESFLRTLNLYTDK